jgi:hypothetical protein
MDPRLAWKGLGAVEKAEVDRSRLKEIEPAFKSSE